jgi:hypothetical protein
MPKGLSLHIGINTVSAGHYEGWTGPLDACEHDAKDMAEIVSNLGYDASMLLTSKATRKAVIHHIREAAKCSVSGDIFVLSYAGHGSRMADLNGDERPPGEDSTWCLYDGEMIDDEISDLMCDFVSGVRIFLLSDSCYSGTISRVGRLRSDTKLKAKHLSANWEAGTELRNNKFRVIPTYEGRETYRANRQFYDKILSNTNFRKKGDIIASMIQISACQDDQLAGDGYRNGVFTGNLRKVWNNGAFIGNYGEFHRSITARIDDKNQVPNMVLLGYADAAFAKQKPFTV